MFLWVLLCWKLTVSTLLLVYPVDGLLGSVSHQTEDIIDSFMMSADANHDQFRFNQWLVFKL